MSRQCSNRGITLLEVAIVIFVIIALAAILLPITFTEKIPHDHANCQHNLKECAVALQLYWNDYDSKLPSSYLVNHSKSWNKHDFLTFATKAGKLPPGENDRLQTWPQILYSHMKNKDVMWCPNDTVNRSNPNSQVSYWYKLANDKAWYGECKRDSDFAYSSDQIAFYEHQGWHFGTSDGLKENDQVYAAFMDSHVELIQIKNATSGDPLDCAANSDGEPMYYNYDNVKKTQDIGPAKHVDPSRFSDKL